MTTRVSLAELIDTDVPVAPDDAVAIVREVCRQHASGTLRGIPNATVIRLTQGGRIAVEGPVSRDHDPVRAAAALLTDLLPGFQSPTGFKVPGGLRLVLARATGALDLPPFADVAEFCAALERFAAADSRDTVRRLFQAWAARQPAAPASVPIDPTISDVRRARRATGLSLEEIARGSGIPASKLRELEWGYVRNWRADDESRDALQRYARAAGIDEAFVMSVAWPLIEGAAAEPVVEAAPVAEPAAGDESWALVPVTPREARVPLPWPVKKPEAILTRHRWLLALAAAILLVVGAMTFGWERPAATSAAATDPSRVPAADFTQRDDDAVPAATTGSTPRATTAALRRDLRPVSYVKQPVPHQRTSTKSKAPQPSPRKSFFKRELFRIVIK